MGKPEKKLTSEVEKMLLSYPWPGNVRELENAIERAMVIGKKSEIQVEDLPLHLDGSKKFSGNAISLADIEKQHIEKLIKETDGNITRTASLLGIDRVTLYNKLKKYGIQR
jgi:DNA-binding NtrC family response regulator